MSIPGRVAIVTGAAGKGMGRSIALTLAREGAKVVVNYRSSLESAEAVVQHILSRRGHALAVEANVFNKEGCTHLVHAAVQEFGQVDICVVNPGSGWHPDPVSRLDSEAALQDIHHEIAPLYYLMPLVLPGMYTRKWGRLIGIALHPTRLPPAYAYNVAKAARAAALLLAQEQVWRSNVTMNVIAPGPVHPIKTFREAVEQCDRGPLWQNRTNISPQDIADGVAFLCSEAGRFITGCVIPYLSHEEKAE